MDTKPLERFATWARRELINAVDAQATAVLAVGSVARSERSEVVKKLEAEIGRHGRQHVVDKVSYAWFNRIIALRFMDARGYTDAAVVSPAQGQAHGQPEILADAKRGNLDTDVVTNSRTFNAIIGLLDGTRRSTDAEGEAYALLLTEYCRYWHKPMPFMFEREGDYTELLVPANLLADDAILARARAVLTEGVCKDIEVIGWLYQFYISERKAKVFEGFRAKGRSRKLAGPDEIPAATQLFTPHWIVRYLVENSLGRLWMLNRPSSRLVDQMNYYVELEDGETDFLRVTKPEDLTVIDPACGSGHMLTFAFDLLYAIYEEEGYSPSDIPGLILAHNLYGTEIDPRAGALAAFALTMKARAKQRTFFNKQVQPNICVIEPFSFESDEVQLVLTSGGDKHEEVAFWNQFADADTFGSLIEPDPGVTTRLGRHLEALGDRDDMIKGDVIHRASRVLRQAEFLAPKYAVVVANPPYMGGKNMSPALAAFAKERFPRSKTDLFAMFIERNRRLAEPHGYVAMITMQSWMFLSSFEALRERIVDHSAVRVVAHLGAGAFESIAGAVVSTCAFVLAATNDQATPGVFVKLDDLVGEAAKNEGLLQGAAVADSSLRFTLSGSQVAQIPGWTYSYWTSPTLLAAFGGGNRLADIADPRQGMATADNGRFLRFWSEVSKARLGLDIENRNDAAATGRKWFPYNKGGSFRRWYGNQEYVVNWEHDGRELMAERPKSVIRSPQYYFHESASWSKVGTAEPAFRYFPPGFLFDVAGTSIFTESRSTLLCALAFGNSIVAREMLRASAASMNLEVGTIAELPVRVRSSDEIEALVGQLIDIYQSDWDLDERSWNFTRPALIAKSESSLRLAIDSAIRAGEKCTAMARELEEDVNRRFIDIYCLDEMLVPDVPVESVALNANYLSRFGIADPGSSRQAAAAAAVHDFVSYAVGCMFGRYSLDESGIILGDQGATVQGYLAKVPTPTFMPDADNVIPFVDDGWFEDDIVERFRQFLRATFGADNFEENLGFVEESLGVKTLRDYFITKAGKSKFYDDHVQRYKKRPIYWMFSSPKGSFNALIYMHRYTLSTVSTVLNEYLREYRAKLEVALVNAEQAAAGGSAANDLKEADRLRKVLVELAEYEHDVLYPLATQQIAIDLDDGVKANYPKFYPALKKIPGLEAAE
ncbi:BREX-1 system adenine-specific DNA-methyltransferase PglX [Cryobacterium sp. TMT2-14]|uniref:BREX-1 system adenine-specific DNA-methyltransferase PglX n=1 Tax=Cryobacterium sp. TMT2-14 TaxID=1259245 RepID=UPI00106C43FD|nr:BREX-1 system adenine-specific DNA-methyltransferase PglX [Cryobacterium sp. TMT2-14]TFC34902.1 BREX-1 system adenine-specific DNA-methyltransferase PglX [Cryobacterium sp. TMT2-14]